MRKIYLHFWMNFEFHHYQTEYILYHNHGQQFYSPVIKQCIFGSLVLFHSYIYLDIFRKFHYNDHFKSEHINTSPLSFMGIHRFCLNFDATDVGGETPIISFSRIP